MFRNTDLIRKANPVKKDDPVSPALQFKIGGYDFGAISQPWVRACSGISLLSHHLGVKTRRCGRLLAKKAIQPLPMR